MANYVLAYKGGTMGETPDEQQKQMEAWMNWFGSLGDSIVDAGNPFGESSGLESDGSTAAATSGLAGYSIITADSMGEAQGKAKGCPVLSTGGTIDIYEAMPIG